MSLFAWLHFLIIVFLAGTEGARQLPSCSETCDMATLCSRETSRLALRAFGLTSYKLRGALWTSNVERRQATLLQNSASVHLKQLDVEHPDYIFFTSHSNSRRWVLARNPVCICTLFSLWSKMQPCEVTKNPLKQQFVELFWKIPAMIYKLDCRKQFAWHDWCFAMIGSYAIWSGFYILKTKKMIKLKKKTKN